MSRGINPWSVISPCLGNDQQQGTHLLWEVAHGWDELAKVGVLAVRPQQAALQAKAAEDAAGLLREAGAD